MAAKAIRITSFGEGEIGNHGTPTDNVPAWMAEMTVIMTVALL